MICDLVYGTFVTEVPSGNGCVYVKVKKKSRKYNCSPNKGIGLQWDTGSCVLFNLKYGTIRQIPAKTRVTPVKPELTILEMDPKHWYTVKKGYAQED